MCDGCKKPQPESPPENPPARRHHDLSLRGAFRPLLTFSIGGALFWMSTYLSFAGKLNPDVWFTTWMQIFGMMVAFFFGERSALKGNDPEVERRAG